MVVRNTETSSSSLTGSVVVSSAYSMASSEITDFSSNVPKDFYANSWQKSVDKAVFQHILSLRTLGNTKANTAEIARALQLSLADVERSVASLQSKKVKVVP